MTFTTVLFYILAFVLVIAAFRVITARSPVTAVLHLILAFANAAMIWMLLGAEFLALLLVLVYVGAVMVLFLFVVMMLDIRIDSLRDGLKTYLPLGLVIGVVLVLEMAFVLGSTWYGVGPQAPVAGDYNNARALGEVMYTQYVYAIEVGAALLLVGMVAAILGFAPYVEFDTIASQIGAVAEGMGWTISTPLCLSQVPHLLGGLKLAPFVDGKLTRTASLIARIGEFGGAPSLIASVSRRLLRDRVLTKLLSDHPWLSGLIQWHADPKSDHVATQSGVYRAAS